MLDFCSTILNRLNLFNLTLGDEHCRWQRGLVSPLVPHCPTFYLNWLCCVRCFCVYVVHPGQLEVGQFRRLGFCFPSSFWFCRFHGLWRVSQVECANPLGFSWGSRFGCRVLRKWGLGFSPSCVFPRLLFLRICWT